MDPSPPAEYPYTPSRMSTINSIVRQYRDLTPETSKTKKTPNNSIAKMTKNTSALITSKSNPASLALSLGRPLSVNDIKHFNDTDLDQFYQNMLTNSTFQISTGENDNVREMMQIAATRPKDLKKFGFSVKKNIKLTELSTDMKLQEDERFKFFKANTSRKFVRLSKLIIVFTPGQTSASKFDARTHFALIDTRVIKANEIVRESFGNLLYSTMTFMDSDYFIPLKEFDDMFLRIKVPGTGLKAGKMWGSVWLHIELETTDSPTQRPISPVRLVPTIPVTSLMTRGDKNPTKYDGYLDTNSLQTMAESCKVVGQVRAQRRGDDDPFEGFNCNSGVQKFTMYDNEEEKELQVADKDFSTPDYCSMMVNLRGMLAELENASSLLKIHNEATNEATAPPEEDDRPIFTDEKNDYQYDHYRHIMDSHAGLVQNKDFCKTHKVYDCDCKTCESANESFSNLNTKRPTKPIPNI